MAYTDPPAPFPENRSPTGDESRAAATSAPAPVGRARGRRASAQQHDSTVSMWVVRALVEGLEKMGTPRAEFLRAAQLDSEQLDATDERVPMAEAFRITEVALDVTQDPALGLHWAEVWTRTSFVPLSYLIDHAPSLMQGFASLRQFERLLCDDPSFELVEHGDKMILRCLNLDGCSPRARRLAAEMVLGSFYRILRSFNEHQLPECASFEHAAPPYQAEYARVFENTQRFDQPFTGIVFGRELLQGRSVHGDADMHEALTAVAERRMSRLARGVPYAQRVRELLTVGPWPERKDMAAVARGLGLSARSLRRRLATEGRSYNDIENEAFAWSAKQLLRAEERSIQETAYEMGFADTTTFHRAFKRSTGTTPRRYREELLGTKSSSR